MIKIRSSLDRSSSRTKVKVIDVNDRAGLIKISIKLSTTVEEYHTTMSSPEKRQKMDQAAIIEAAMSAMTDATNPAVFDVTIICTTDDFQASYWMDRLSSGVCKSSSSDSTSKYPMVIAVSEDWSSSSGAGNGLGTLYAFQKACNVGKEKYGVDLAQELMEGKISAALYHTAGKGTRLAPLPASENNNKPGVVS